MLGTVAPDPDDLITSPRALFDHLNRLDYRAARLLLEELAARGHGVHPAVVALAFGKDQVLAKLVRRLLVQGIEHPELQRILEAREPRFVVSLAETGNFIEGMGHATPATLAACREQALSAIEVALTWPRSRIDGLAALPWLVALASSRSEVASAARQIAEDILTARSATTTRSSSDSWEPEPRLYVRNSRTPPSPPPQ